MRSYFLNLVLTAIFVLTICNVSILYSEISVEPHGIATLMEPNSDQVVEVELSNDGEVDLTFEIKFRSPPNDEDQDQDQGPRRDDFGDILEFYGMNNYYWCGMAYNGEDILVADYDNQRIHFWNIEEEELTDDFGVDYSPWSAAFDGQNYWISADNPNRLRNIDREGDLLSTINLNFIPAGVAFDGENLWVSPYGGNGVLRYMTVEGEEIRNVDCSGMNGIASWTMTWVPEHDGEHLWVMTEGARLMQLRYDEDEEEFEILQGTNYNYNGTYGLTHDGENLWFSVYLAGGDGWGIGIIDDGIIEPRWLSADPKEGIIESNSEATIELSFNSEGYEPGTYHLLVVVESNETGDDPDPEFHSIIEFSALMSIDLDCGNITGVITNADNNRAIEGAWIELQNYKINRLTDEEGTYSIENLPFEVYELIVSAPDFLDQTLQVEIDAVEEFEVSAALLHSECNLDPPEIITELAPGQDDEILIEVENSGNGPLTFSIEKRLPGDANLDPWTRRSTYHVGADREDRGIQGVVFDGERFYVAGQRDGNPAIYIFDSDGEYIDEFDQPGDHNRGFKDMAWDGELIWGVVGAAIWSFDIQGENATSYDAPFNPTTNLAWDGDHNWLWASSTTSNIVALDANGDVQEEISRGDLRVYGLAYYPQDEYPVYIFAKENDTDRPFIHKGNPESNEVVFVNYLDTEEGGSPYGIHITNKFDIYSWVMIAISNDAGDDRIDIWQVEGNKEWFSFDPMAGVIEAGATDQFTLTLDASDLPTERFEAEIVFHHDGIGGETTLPVLLDVIDSPVQAEFTVEMVMGWSMVSAYLQPDEEDIRTLMAPLVDDEILILMKDGLGRFYNPEYNYNSIPFWSVSEGYLMKTTQATSLTLEGMTVRFDEPIPLTEGWQMISYYPREPVDAITALSGIEDVLILAKDGWGRFYNTEYGYSNMGDMEAGRGYLVKVAEDIDLVYRLEEEGARAASNRTSKSMVEPGLINTGVNMSLLILGNSPDNLIEEEISVYAGDRIVGSGVFTLEGCGIAIWGDDPTTDNIDGALKDQPLELTINANHSRKKLEFKVLSGEANYFTDSFWAIELLEMTDLPNVFEIGAVYPNPFNSVTIISFGLPRDAKISLKIFDLTGREVETLIDGELNAGRHSISWNGISSAGNPTATGVYFCRLEAEGKILTQKVVLVK